METVKPLEPDPRVRQIELLISNLLRIGVTLSLCVVALGTIVTFVHHPDYRSSQQALERLTGPNAQFPHTLHDVAQGLSHFSGQSIVILGLLLLILTPILRVAISIFAFAYEGNRTFVYITSLVLLLLLLSFALGKAGG